MSRYLTRQTYPSARTAVSAAAIAGRSAGGPACGFPQRGLVVSYCPPPRDAKPARRKGKCGRDRGKAAVPWWRRRKSKTVKVREYLGIRGHRAQRSSSGHLLECLGGELGDAASCRASPNSRGPAREHHPRLAQLIYQPPLTEIVCPCM